jgi:predicted O-linked N-acetylglucosamine transferase (SPINDLY family)
MTRKIKQLTKSRSSLKRPFLATEPFSFPNIETAIEFHQMGKLEDAELIYQKLIEVDPKNADAFHLLGVIAYQTGRYQDAIELIDTAIAINPSFAIFYSNRGNALQELKQFDAAVTSFQKAISVNPNYVEAYFNLGNAFKELKKFDAAVRSFDVAIAMKPDYAEAHSNRGNALMELMQFDAAVLSFEKAIAIKPDYAEAYSNRGNAMYQLKQFDAAVASNDQAIKLKPELAEAYSNRGNALRELKDFEASIASYNKAIELKPDYVDAYFNRGVTFQEFKQLVAAIKSYDMALALQHDYEYLFGIRQHARMLVCDWQDFEISVLELSRKIQINEKASICFPALALPISLHNQYQLARLWSTHKYPYNNSLGPILKSVRRSKIRIGYFSADFHNHATAYLMAELFELHDKAEFELIAFSFGTNSKDEMQSRLMSAFDQFIDVTAMSDEAVAKKSRLLGIDIAVDLKGLTKESRLGIFSYKAAPIQVSYLGYPGTLGASYVEYLIADQTLIAKANQQYYTEKIVYLPNSYQVNDRRKVISPKILNKKDFGLPQDSFVFCCFNNNFKITPPVFDGWVRILKAVDKSVLWLMEDNKEAAKNLRKEAQLRGLDPDRLIFAKRINLPEHLGRQRLADLFLDTMPYNAHTTASDALWAGLPVLTLMGESLASRVAASLLNAIEVPELITTTQSDYEVLAIELATNPLKLMLLKNKLEKNRLTAPLFDTTRFTKNIEVAYKMMYERYQADIPPDHIYVVDLS